MANWGIITAAVTPFADDGSVDEDGFVAAPPASARQRLGRGSSWPAPPARERRHTDEEKLRLFELAVSEFGERGTIVAGTGSNDTAHTVHLTEKATEIGCDASLCVTPYYNKPNFRVFVGHYEAIALPPTSRSCSTTSLALRR